MGAGSGNCWSHRLTGAALGAGAGALLAVAIGAVFFTTSHDEQMLIAGKMETVHVTEAKQSPGLLFAVPIGALIGLTVAECSLRSGIGKKSE